MVTRRKGAGLVAVTVTGPAHLTHAGKLYKAGATVEVPEPVADQLVEAGAVTRERKPRVRR